MLRANRNLQFTFYWLILVTIKRPPYSLRELHIFHLHRPTLISFVSGVKWRKFHRNPSVILFHGLYKLKWPEGTLGNAISKLFKLNFTKCYRSEIWVCWFTTWVNVFDCVESMFNVQQWHELMIFGFRFYCRFNCILEITEHFQFDPNWNRDYSNQKWNIRHNTYLTTNIFPPIWLASFEIRNLQWIKY